jgi:hypothetical protein
MLTNQAPFLYGVSSFPPLDRTAKFKFLFYNSNALLKVDNEDINAGARETESKVMWGKYAVPQGVVDARARADPRNLFRDIA